MKVSWGTSMDGGSRAHEREVPENIPSRDCDILGEKYQNDTIESIQTVHACSGGRTGDGTPGAISLGINSGTKSLQNASTRNGLSNKKRTRKRLWHPLDQTGGNHVSLSASGRRPPTLVGSSIPYQTSAPRKSSKVQCESDNYCTGPRDAKGISEAPGIITPTMLKLCYDQVPYLKRYSLLYTRRSSKLAKAEGFNIPLHVKPNVPILDVHQARKWMSAAAEARFEEVWEELLCMPAVPEAPPRVKSGLSSLDYEHLVQHGVISLLSPQEVQERPSFQYLIR